MARVKKIIHKSCIRSADKAVIDKMHRLLNRFEEMIDPGHKSSKEDLYELSLKFPRQVADLLKIIPRMGKEYELCYAASEEAASIMQKKGREARKDRFSSQRAQKYYVFIEGIAELKPYQLNHAALIALRERARNMVDYDSGNTMQKKGSWVSGLN